MLSNVGPAAHALNRSITHQRRAAGSGLTGTHDDLGDGPVYAARTFLTSEANRDVSIVLNQTLHTALAAAAGGPFASGGEVGHSGRRSRQ